MVEENKELAVTENQSTGLPAIADQLAELGVSAQDLIIPKLLLMQNTSEYVGDKKAAMGDIVNSQSLEVVGGIGKDLAIVPLKMYKTWRVYNMDSGQPEFVRQDAVTAQNEKLPWEDMEEIDGKKVPIRRDLCLNFFVLLRTDLENGDAFPLVVSFKRTSTQAGRQLATHLFKMACLGRLPYSQTQVLQVKAQKKDKNTYGVYEIAKGAELTEEQKQLAGDWLKRLASITYKVDESEDEVPETAAPAAAPVVVGGQPDMKF